MRNYIILNGKNSNEINGLLIQELPPISKPLIRTEVEEIDGRDGDIVTPLGYSAYDKELTIGLYKDFDVNEVAAYFNSEGTVIFSNEPDKYYYYQITAQIDFERLVRYRTATVTMHCQPFKYSATEQPITEDVSGTVSDEGTNIALENTAEAPFNTLDLKGNTSQQTYSGKNLIDTYSFVGKQAAGTLTVSADGVLTLTGNTNSNGWCAINGSNTTLKDLAPSLVAGTTYYLYFQGENLARTHIYLNGSATQWSHGQAHTMTQAELDSFIVIYGGYNTTTKFKIMVTTALDGTYEKYVGGTSSPNPSYPQPVQVVTGKNTVKIHGKNLLDIKNNLKASDGGLIFSYSNDELVVSGTPTRSYANVTNEINTFLEAGQYTLSLSEAVSHRVYIWVRYTDGVAASLGIINAGSTSVTTTFAKDVDQIRLDFSVMTTGVALSESFSVQLEKGSAKSDFEPYQEQSYEINLGKNLFNPSVAAHPTGMPNNIGETLPVVPNTTYSFNVGDSRSYAQVQLFDSGGTRTRTLGNGVNDHLLTFTTTVSEVSALVCFYPGSSGVDPSTYDYTGVQFEIGQPTTYAPYFTPIELCNIPGTDYRDRFIPRDGKWYVRKEVGKYVYNDDLTGNGISSTLVAMLTPALPIAPNLSTLDGVAVSNMYGTISTEITKLGGTTSISCIRVNTSIDIADSYNAVKALAAANNLTIYYALATPTDTEITNEALIEQLNDIYYHARAYKGRTHITSSAATGNVPHIIAAEVGEDNESTITNAGNYLSKPKITVYGSGDISLYINDMHVLQITLGDEGYITIDTAQMEAYKDTLDNLKNRLVIGDYSNARLKPGANKIHFTGTVTKYVVENYSRWL